MEGKPIDPSNESIEVGAGPGGVDVSARALAKSTLASIKEGSHAGGCPGTRRGLIRQDPRLPVAQIAITIDTECPDHPARDPIATCEELLDILRSSRVPATFFIVGSWARAYPTLVQWIAGQGHLIGAHGYAHCNLEKMTDDGIVADLTECHEFILKAGSETKPWFRAPYGDVGAPAPRIPDTIEAAGYRHIHWDAGGCDWDPDLTAEDVTARTLAEIEAHGGPASIVLFHSWPDRTPPAMSLVLDDLSSSGADYVTVDQLF